MKFLKQTILLVMSVLALQCVTPAQTVQRNSGQSRQIATTEDERKVILKSDGTWAYESGAREELNPTKRVSVFIKQDQPIGGKLLSITDDKISVDSGGNIHNIPLSRVDSYIVFDGDKQEEFFPPKGLTSVQSDSGSQQTLSNEVTQTQPPLEPGRAQVNEAKAQKSKLKVEYDKFDDATTLRTPPLKVKENNILRLEDSFSLSLSGAFVYRGRPDSPIAAGNYVLGFEAWAPRQMILRNADALSVIADSNRLSFDAVGYERNGEYEVVFAKLNKEQFQTIAYATTVQMRIGLYEFSLSRKQLETFRELAQRADAIQTVIRSKN